MRMYKTKKRNRLQYIYVSAKQIDFNFHFDQKSITQKYATNLNTHSSVLTLHWWYVGSMLIAHYLQVYLPAAHIFGTIMRICDGGSQKYWWLLTKATANLVKRPNSKDCHDFSVLIAHIPLL